MWQAQGAEGVYTLVVSNNAVLWDKADACCAWTNIGDGKWFTYFEDVEAHRKSRNWQSGNNPLGTLHKLAKLF